MFDQIYIFSFNRWQFLDNCVRSVERNFKSPKITIVDDNSDDPETIKYLEQLDQKHRVISPHSEETPTKYKNLYNNKNWVMDEAKKLNYDYIIMMPEDSQIVRSFLGSDEKQIKKLFDSTENVFQCFPFFVEKVYRYANFEKKLQLLDDCRFFIKKNNVISNRLNYSDFGIINVDKFFSLLGKYKSSEKLNEELCIERDIVVAYGSYPFCALLPFNKYNRVNGNKKLTNLINEIAQTGFYPYKDISQLEIDNLFAKSPSKIAYAEDWLNSPDVPNKNLWSFWGGFFNLEVYDDERKNLAHTLQEIKESALAEEEKHNLMIIECEKYLQDLNDGKYASKNTSYIYN